MYVRYQSFESREALEDGVRKANPYKIDIGAIFSVKVSRQLVCVCECILLTKYIILCNRFVHASLDLLSLQFGGFGDFYAKYTVSHPIAFYTL